MKCKAFDRIIAILLAVLFATFTLIPMIAHAELEEGACEGEDACIIEGPGNGTHESPSKSNDSKGKKSHARCTLHHEE